MSDPTDETLDGAVEQTFADNFFARADHEFAIDFGAASHVGLMRESNEDHYAIFRLRRSAEVMLASLPASALETRGTYAYSMVVADGMGGMQAGEVASRVALQTMAELTGQASSWVMMLADSDVQQIQQRVGAYVERIQAAILSHGSADPKTAGMGTTWTSAHFLGRNAVVVQLGDSRAYLYRNDLLRQVTHDETMAQVMLDAGMEPEGVVRFGHILLNYFGGDSGDSPAASTFYESLKPGDRFLLCTDGLTDMVSEEEIAAQLREQLSAQATCDRLVQLALENGGQDNVTVLLASVTDSH